MTTPSRSIVVIRAATIGLCLLSVAVGLFLAFRAGYKLWWQVGAAVLAVPGCFLAGEMLATVVESRGGQKPNHDALPKLAHQLRLAAVFSALLLGWLSLSLIGHFPRQPLFIWIIYGGVSLAFPAALLLSASLAEQIARNPPSNPG